MSSVNLVLIYYGIFPSNQNPIIKTEDEQDIVKQGQICGKKTVRKLARLDGTQYQGSGRDKTVIIDKRRMCPTCTSTYCQKSKNRHCSTFDEERRKAMVLNSGTWGPG